VYSLEDFGTVADAVLPELGLKRRERALEKLLNEYSDPPIIRTSNGYYELNRDSLFWSMFMPEKIGLSE